MLTLIATRMRRDKVRNVPNDIVDDDPAIVLFVMLLDLFDSDTRIRHVSVSWEVLWQALSLSGLVVNGRCFAIICTELVADGAPGRSPMASPATIIDANS